MPEDKNSRLIAQILSGRASSYDKITVAAAFILALIIHVLLIETLPKNFEPRNLELDDEVDELFNTVKQELIGMIHENVDSGEQAANLLMVAKYMERIGDHATNISEWVIFSITGHHEE